LNEETALVALPKNPDALAKNLIRVLTDNLLRINIAEKGLQQIKQFP
jgi:hypothetical protein